MRREHVIRTRSYHRKGRLVPRRAVGLRAGSVVLKPGEQMPWHSTRAREELLLAFQGRVIVEAGLSSRRIRRVILGAGRCLFLPRETPHRVVNRSRALARYLYISAPTR